MSLPWNNTTVMLILQVEAIVQRIVSEGVVVDARETALSDAMKIPSLRAMKGEARIDALISSSTAFDVISNITLLI
jgi:hypothetical protein